MVEKQEIKTSGVEESRVYFLKTSKGLFDLSVLSKYEKKRRRSKQIRRDEEAYMDQNKLVPLPFNAPALLDLQENCSYFDASVRQIARDVIGHGWELVPVSEEEEEDESEKKEKELQFERQKIKCDEFLNRVNDERESISDVVEQSVIDWGVIGWMSIEVSRDKGEEEIGKQKEEEEEKIEQGEVDGLWHLPAHTIRVHVDGEKYCQIVNEKRRWFERFGSDMKIDMNTGKVMDEEEEDSVREANELIFLKQYYPQSEYYGVPNILPAIGSVYGLIGARSYNLAFFENYGIPAAIVTLEGKWQENSTKMINDFLDAEIKGSENAHKTLVMELASGAKITWMPLITDIKEGSFEIFTKEWRNEILAVYKMPPYRIGIAEIGALGENVAKETTKIYAESVIGPLKQTIGKLITNMILHEGLNCELVQFRWKAMDIRNLGEMVKMWETMFGMGVINRNYMRSQLGESPIDEEEGGNQYYIRNYFVPWGQEAAVGLAMDTTKDVEILRDEVMDELKRVKEWRENENKKM